MKILSPASSDPIQQRTWLLLELALFGLVLSVFSGCGGAVVKQTQAETKIVKAAPPGLPMWLGNPARNFYGNGPWSDKALHVVWDFKTQWSAGRLHKDPWAGSGWPGQAAEIEGPDAFRLKVWEIADELGVHHRHPVAEDRHSGVDARACRPGSDGPHISG